MGALPSQQPPDWWNSRSPCSFRRVAMTCAAASVSRTRSTMVCDPTRCATSREGGRAGRRRAAASEETQWLRAVADEQVLGLLVVVQHHLVVLAPDAGLLIAAKGRVRGIEVIAVDPDAARLDRASEPIGAVDVARPDSGAEAV